MAAIAPSPSGTAACMASPRRRQRRTASSSPSAPAATSALYSPSEWPAANEGRGSSGTASRSASSTATLVVTMAGWVFAVCVSASLGPSKQSGEMAPEPSSRVRARSARSNTARARGEASSTLLPMPTSCVPCPGNSQAIFTVGDASPQRRHEDPLAAAEAPVGEAAVERDRDGGARGVAGLVEDQNEPLERDRPALRDGLEDAEVRLVRDEAIDVAQCQPSGRDDLLADIGHAAHGRAEDVLPEHVHLVAPCGEAPLGRRLRASACRDLERRREGAVAVDAARLDPAGVARLGPLDEHRAGAIAEQDSGGAIRPVDDAAEQLHADDEHAPCPARSDELVRDGQPEQEARARRADVEGGNLACAQLVLESHRARRHRAVGGDRRRDDHVERRSAHAGGLERAGVTRPPRGRW
jgi:hypothetical protein